MSNLGNKIAAIRRQKALSQEELADQANINVRTLQRIEKGETEPRGHTLNAVCQVLDLRPEDVLEYGQEEDRQFRAILHLSVLAFLLFPLGNILLPLILWFSKGKKVVQAHRQGANILNFQILWTLVTYPLITIGALLRLESTANTGVFFIAFGLLYLLNIVLPIVAALQVRQNKGVRFYPEWVRLVK